MKLEQFNSGKYEKQQKAYSSFSPAFIHHSWTWEDSELNMLLEKANQSLGGLESFSKLIPNIDIYIRLHLKTEAHKSNKIEGTKTTIEEDMMNIEDVAPEKRDDRVEVENYINAINAGVDIITKGELPLCARLIKKLHSILLQGVRGNHKTPGEFRKSQNWIGGSTPSNAIFVPPHHLEISDLISDLEFFLADEDILIPNLIKIAIAHYQFETIHPFLDGNGRLGRLIIPLFLLDKKVLSKPCFYISDFFEKNKTDYYDHLTRVRTNNDMLAWLKFFLTAVIETSEKAKTKFKKVVDLVSSYRELEYELPGKNENIAKILNCFYDDPILSINEIQKQTKLGRSTIERIIRTLQQKKYVSEITNFQRNKLFLLDEYFNIFIM